MEEKKLEAPKQTPADLYLMVPHATENGTRVVFLSVKKIKSLQGIAPTKEILQTHFEAERVRMQLAEQKANENDKKAKYLPQPLYLQIESSIFAAIVEEARAKDRWVGSDALALTLGSQIPCCVISAMPEEQPVQAEEQPKQVRKKKTSKIVINND